MTTETNIKRERNPMEFYTLKIKNESPFLFVEIDARPINLMGLCFPLWYRIGDKICRLLRYEWMMNVIMGFNTPSQCFYSGFEILKQVESQVINNCLTLFRLMTTGSLFGALKK